MNKSSFSAKTQKARAKFLGAYYGHPIRDMKLICVTGSTGRATVVKLLHEILRAAGMHAAVLATDAEVKPGMLHKFFAEAWKAGANYVIVSTPVMSVRKNVFYDLPVEVLAVTDYIPSTYEALSYEDFVEGVKELLGNRPEYLVLNADDKSVQEFENYDGVRNTYTYGRDVRATVRIVNSVLYKKGVEATLGIGSSFFPCASFLTGEVAVSYMACAATVATALNISSNTVSEGMANYEPEEAK